MSSVQSAPLTRAPSARGEPAPQHAWREVVALTLGAPLVVYGVHSADPFLLRTGFPWLCLIPLLVGGQHGAAAGASSAALLLAGAWLHGLALETVPASLAAWGAGMLAVGVISGHFRDRRGAQLAQLAVQAEQADERVVRLTRAHAALEVSHRALEERLSAQRCSIDAAMSEARRQLSHEQGPAGWGKVLLSVLCNHASVSCASLLLAAPSPGRRHGARRRLELVAQIGPPRSADPEHPLVQRALDRRRLVAVDASCDDHGDAAILAAVPLLAASGRELGVLIVHDMPFMLFHAANLRNLAALVAHLSDLLADRALGPVSDARAPIRGPGTLTGTGGGDEVTLEDSERSSAEVFVGTRTGTHRRPSAVRSA